MKSLFLRQKGVTLVELMVAVLIGLLSMFAVYRVYEGTERVKRNVVSIGDAQISGLYSIFVLENNIKSAGSEIMTLLDVNGEQGNGQLLANCADTGIWGTKGAMGPAGTKATFSFRPIPVLIVPNRTNFDDIFVFSGNSTFRLDPVTVTGIAAPDMTVTTPFGFKQGDVLVDTKTQAGTLGAPGAACQAYFVPKDFPAVPVVSSAGSMVSAATLDLKSAATPAINNRLVDLGKPIRNHFYVDDVDTLQMEQWVLEPDGLWKLGRTDPIVSGVISLRALYGIGPVTNAIGASGGNVIGPVNQWVLANDSPWNAESIQAMPLQAPSPVNTVRQIKAVWLSIIVRVGEPESDSDAAANLPTELQQFSICPSGTTCPTSSIPAVQLKPGWRYRMYETMIPLINVIWS